MKGGRGKRRRRGEEEGEEGKQTHVVVFVRLGPVLLVGGDESFDGQVGVLVGLPRPVEGGKKGQRAGFPPRCSSLLSHTGLVTAPLNYPVPRSGRTSIVHRGGERSNAPSLRPQNDMGQLVVVDLTNDLSTPLLDEPLDG
jgi:hypothetical protein